MPAPKCTDGEFLELWQAHQGNAYKIAKVLGIEYRAVYKRRRRIEGRHNIAVPGGTTRPDIAQHYKHLSPETHAAHHHIGIENGVILVGSDCHFWPGVRTTAYRGFLKFIEDMQPKAVVLNGDVFDGASISRHPRIGREHVPSVIEELKAAQDRLTEIEDVAGRAKLVWPLGNHCARFNSRLAANAPEFGNVHGFQLKDHFPAWKPCWAAWPTDKVVIKHRLKNGIHATHTNTLNSGVSIITGHLHSLKVTPFTDYNGTRYGVDTGTMADPKGPQFVNYTEAGPTNWRSGFAVLTFHNGRLLWPELVHVLSESQVEFRGSVIDV